ncbi:MAG: hypothetical protein ACK59M_14905 [Pseudomonadota bacterium]|jgi:hypothetical protein
MRQVIDLLAPPQMPYAAVALLGLTVVAVANVGGVWHSNEIGQTFVVQAIFASCAVALSILLLKLLDYMQGWALRKA